MKKLFWAGLVAEVVVASYLGWQYAAARERAWARKPSK
jgi:hypothetical protein